MATLRNYTERRSYFGTSLKFILPAVGLVLVGVMVIPPLLQGKGADPKIAIEQSAKGDEVEKTANIENLVYEGKTDNAHFKISAKSLKKESTGIDLKEPNGTLTSNNGITTTIFAKTGTYNSDNEIITLKDSVKITSSNNTALQSQHITINTKTNTIISHGRTTITRDGMKMQGDGATITQDNKFKLTGNVRLVQSQLVQSQ